MTDTTEPRDPRVDPRVGPTPTNPSGEVSENPPCFALDIYRHPVKCDTPDPCLTQLNQTLYWVQECLVGNPPIDEWCLVWPEPGHPACTPIPTATTVVAVGEPPVPTLPATGAGPVGSMILAAIVAVVGGVASAIARWRR